MSDLVKVISDKNFSGEEKEVLSRFEEFQLAMIEKNYDKLNEIMLDNYHLTHMSGRKQDKEDFIAEIMDGILNYYESIIDYPEIILEKNQALLIADVTLEAKVYGAKGRWTLHTRANFERIDDEWYFGEWEN